MNARWGAALALVLLIPASASPAASQDVGRMGSRILSMESWTYDAIEGLRTRGYLAELNPLSQPYRRIDVAAQLAKVDPAAITGEPLATWVGRLREELAPELRRLAGEDVESEHIGFDLLLGASAADSRRRDALVPYRTDEEEGLTDRLWPYSGGGLWMETHNVAAEANLFRDRWTKDTHGDPDGANPGGFKYLGRSEKAYLTMAQPWGNVWVGRLARNWGPLGQTGLMISDNATTYPSVGLDLGRGRLTAQFVAGELEELEGRRRYLVANRLDYSVRDAWFSLGESVLYSGQGSTLRLINPLEVLFFDHNAQNDTPTTSISGNVMVEAMFWARLGEGTVYGEFTLDDFDLNPRIGTEERPIEATSYHIALGGRYFGVSDRAALGFDYRRVSGWSYRSGVRAERWTYQERGLGDPWSDYDRLTLRADLFPSVSGLRISPVLQFQRKGEGDYRDPFPEDLQGRTGIFHGVLETTKRVALQGRYQPRREAFLEWDVGRSFISNPGHRADASEQRFSFVAWLGLTFGWSGGAARYD